MWTKTYGRVVSILAVVVLISRDVYSLLNYMHLEIAPAETRPVELSYISKPNSSTIDVLCWFNLEAHYLKIICPVLDGVAGFENNRADISQNSDKCRSADNNHCSQVIRSIPWERIENYTTFTCVCWIRRQTLTDFKNKASIKIKKYDRKINKTTVLRRRISQEKNIHLHCGITGHPTPEITWYKDKIPLSINAGNTIINNVRYQQRNGRLVLSRTDVRGSGNYQCLARNAAGYGWGGNYLVKFYEISTNVEMNESKPQHGIKPNHFTEISTNVEMSESKLQHGIKPNHFTVHYISTTQMAKNFPSLLTSQSEQPVETINDEEEEEEENKPSQSSNSASNAVAVLLSFVMCVIVTVGGIFIFKTCRKRLISNTLENTLVPSFDATKSVPTHDFSIYNKLVALPDKLFGESSQETMQTSKKYNFNKSPHSGSLRSCEEVQPVSFAPSVSTSYSSSVFDNVEFSPVDWDIGVRVHATNNDIPEVSTTNFERSPDMPSPDVSTNSDDNVDCITPKSWTFSPIDRDTELSVDTTNNETCEVSTATFQSSSSMPSPHLSTKSETSALLDKLITIPPNADQRYSSCSLIDHNGGEVILTGTGVRLIIPEGALDVGKTEVVYLALPCNSQYIPKAKGKELNDDETLLSPVVLCGPHGLRFKKYVLLVLPHCVVVTGEVETKFRVLCSDTAPEIAPDWKEVFSNKEKPDQDVFCYMGEQHFSLFILHFTWYVIPGEGLARNFSVAGYHTSFHQPNEDFKVRLYFIPQDSFVSQQKVDDSEKKLQGTLSDGQKTKIFHRNGGDVKCEAMQLNEGWKLVDDTIQTQGYKELCFSLDESPNQTFHFQHEVSRPERISCKFRVSQEGCQSDTPVDISVSLHFESEIKRAQFQSNNTSFVRHISSSFDSGFREGSPIRFIPTGLRKDLIQLLDRCSVGLNNWEILSERLGYDLQFTRWLRDTPSIHSKTEVLLMEWEHDVKESPEDALRSLEGILRDMQREDAALKIQQYFAEFLIRKETTV